tara:strand:+ start:1328 stop:1681 length:354 start_codon:yes stop_codon:yes gene_type:complete
MNTVSNLVELKNWETVCQLDDLIDDVGVCVLVNDKQVALFRLSGSETIYAISNYDPFSKVNVLSRGMTGDLNGHPVVASPIYKQHFNLINGQCLEDNSVFIPVYQVQVVGSMVQVAE